MKTDKEIQVRYVGDTINTHIIWWGSL